MSSHEIICTHMPGSIDWVCARDGVMDGYLLYIDRKQTDQKRTIETSPFLKSDSPAAILYHAGKQAIVPFNA
jgi:hypothetical protein